MASKKSPKKPTQGKALKKIDENHDRDLNAAESGSVFDRHHALKLHLREKDVMSLPIVGLVADTSYPNDYINTTVDMVKSAFPLTRRYSSSSKAINPKDANDNYIPEPQKYLFTPNILLILSNTDQIPRLLKTIFVETLRGEHFQTAVYFIGKHAQVMVDYAKQLVPGALAFGYKDPKIPDLIDELRIMHTVMQHAVSFAPPHPFFCNTEHLSMLTRLRECAINRLPILLNTKGQREDFVPRVAQYVQTVLKTTRSNFMGDIYTLPLNELIDEHKRVSRNGVYVIPDMDKIRLVYQMRLEKVFDQHLHRNGVFLIPYHDDPYNFVKTQPLRNATALSDITFTPCEQVDHISRFFDRRMADLERPVTVSPNHANNIDYKAIKPAEPFDLYAMRTALTEQLIDQMEHLTYGNAMVGSQLLGIPRTSYTKYREDKLQREADKK